MEKEEKGKKGKVSAAHMRATKKYEDKAYFKTLVRFPKDRECDIRNAAGESLNGFIVKAVLERVDQGKEGRGKV